MPYYRWRGVELTGNIKKGTLFARSLEHLDALLFKRQIALLGAKPTWQFFRKPIGWIEVDQFFKQLAVLVGAGVLLPDALAIVGDQLSHPGMQEIVHALAVQVQEGVSLSKAMKQYPKIFNHFMVQLVHAGEESGRLAQTIDGICIHIQATQDFYSRLRTALLLPAITLLFFIIVVLTIFIVIMPKFLDIFTSMNQPIPPLTKKLLAVSSFMASKYALLMVLGIGLIILALFKWASTRKGKQLVDRAVLSVPFVGTILQQRFLAYVLQSLAFLVEGGIPIYQSLTIIRSTLTNHVFQEQIWYLEQDIAAGSLLSEAMLCHPDNVFSQDTIAIIEVGQASGNLIPLLSRAAQVYHARVMKKLSLFTMLLQPIIMIILGLLVGVLIFAVYGPIFNMAHAF